MKKLFFVVLLVGLLLTCWQPVNNYYYEYNYFYGDEEEESEMLDWNESANDCTLETSGTGGGVVGNEELSHDGDDDTYSQTGQGGSGPGEGIWTFTFAGARSIEEFRFKVKGAVSGDPPPSYATMKFEYYDGAWHTLATGVQLTGVATWYEYSVGYLNVTKVRVTGGCYFLGNGPPKQSLSLLYTATADGDVFASGLKVNTSGGMVQIAGETLLPAVHKLRVKKSAAIVGIPLVLITDDWASPIRIYDGSSIKALMKFN